MVIQTVTIPLDGRLAHHGAFPIKCQGIGLVVLGYLSHYGTRLYFGLGSRDRVDRLEIRWIGGKTETFENITVDQKITLVEGTGRAAIK